MSSRLCKYHGRSCESAGRCLTHSPRKYEGDGHMETIDPERLTLGCVLRRNTLNGCLSAFSDNVVIGMYVSYSARRQKDTGTDKEHFLTLDAALGAATKDDSVYVVLTRPYLYASNVFGSMPNWLQGVERYEVSGNILTDTHRVVVQSTGEYSCFMAKEPLHTWKVLVKGETVFDDLDEGGAKAYFKIHRQMAQGGYGRTPGGTVTLLCDGEVYEEYKGEA